MKIVSRNDIRKLLEPPITKFTEKYWKLEGMARDLEIGKMLMEETSYAILSHRWLPDELTFQDMVTMEQKEIGRGSGEDQLESWRRHMLRHGKGVGGALDKVFHFCKTVLHLRKFPELYDCKYVWFDTGCINKKSSAELEESIRSMFNWYRNSEICIVHLHETTSAFTMRKDQWFTRGWTLQELLAPTKIKFYDREWRSITAVPNDRVEDNELGFPLWTNISTITGIPVNELRSFTPGLHDIRQRMVWAYRRKTTRIEDLAYCLIGIFRIGLSIAYGEGHLAFHRLQMEIMERNDDKSLFVWKGEPSAYNSMFAAAPACFVPTRGSSPAEEETIGSSSIDTAYALTNRGLRIRLPVYEEQEVLPQDIAWALPDQHPSDPLRIAILRHIDSSTSMAALLYRCNNSRQHKRIATTRIFKIQRPKQLRPAEEIFIV
jgi:hypothetical protein